MQADLATLIYIAGWGQLTILIAAAIVPLKLNWREELNVLPRLHRQMYWVYGGYIVLAIVSLGLISIFNAKQLANGSGLARGFCGYVVLFWGIRLVLQFVFDVKDQLTPWPLRLGYRLLTAFFLYFTVVYAWAALAPASP